MESEFEEWKSKGKEKISKLKEEADKLKEKIHSDTSIRNKEFLETITSIPLTKEENEQIEKDSEEQAKELMK